MRMSHYISKNCRFKQNSYVENVRRKALYLTGSELNATCELLLNREQTKGIL